MLDKTCPYCTEDVGLGTFLAAVTSGKSKLLCPHCGETIKRDMSLFVGLFFIGFTMFLFPVMVMFGMSSNLAGRSVERIQLIFDVGPNAAFAIGMGTLLGFVVLYYLVFSIVYTRIDFDEKEGPGANE